MAGMGPALAELAVLGDLYPMAEVRLAPGRDGVRFVAVVRDPAGRGCVLVAGSGRELRYELGAELARGARLLGAVFPSYVFVVVTGRRGHRAVEAVRRPGAPSAGVYAVRSADLAELARTLAAGP